MRENGKSNGSNGTRRPEQIQAEIERTRNEMDATLSAIEHRLTPGQLVDQGIDYLKNSGARQYFTNLGGSVKDNPLPVTLAGIGLAWLAAVANRPVQYKFVETGAPQGPGALDGAREKFGEARDRVGSGMNAARDKAQQTGQKLGQMKDQASARVAEMTDAARGQAERARQGWNTMLDEHPLALGAIGLAIGAVAAAMAPRTRREDELMGGARDRLLDEAKAAGAEKLAQARDTAKEAMGESKPQAQPKPAGSKP
jgi:hypothetical protein